MKKNAENVILLPPGVIKSISTHTYFVDEVSFTFTVDQTISYDECVHQYADQPDGPPTLRLAVSRNFVVFDEREQIVRYAQTNKIAPLSGKVDYI